MQAERFVPARGENIKGNLTADGISQTEVSKLLLKHAHKSLPPAMLVVEFLKSVTFLLRAIPPRSQAEATR